MLRSSNIGANSMHPINVNTVWSGLYVQLFRVYTEQGFLLAPWTMQILGFIDVIYVQLTNIKLLSNR